MKAEISSLNNSLLNFIIEFGQMVLKISDNRVNYIK